MTTYDVIVAGAGPVGLTVASELALHGLDVLVVERLTEPDLGLKAGGITAAATEALVRRGLGPDLEAANQRANAAAGDFLRARRKPTSGQAGKQRAGHFAGLVIEAALAEPTRPTMVSQPELERILAEHAERLGVSVRRGVEVTGLRQDGSGVTVELGAQRLRARWLVGADGGRSTVRKLAGIGFSGTDGQITARQAIAELSGTEALERGGWNITPHGVYVFPLLLGRVFVVEFDGPPAERSTPVDAAELQASLRRVSGTDVTVDRVITSTRFTDNVRLADSYRAGRVLLAGDAAHVHPPFGGQGLALGLGDAINLGWKLAATVRGWAPAGLLDTYGEERRPVAAAVLDWTRAQTLLLRPDPHARALRAIVADLADTTDGGNYFAERISGVRQRYDLGSDDPQVGRAGPVLPMPYGRGVLIGASARGYRDRLDETEGEQPMLLRPDGVVAWRAGDGPLETPLTRWFGLPGPN